MEEFDSDRSAVLQRAAEAGVGTILCPIEASSERSLAVTLNLPSGRPAILAAAGLHPHQAKLLSPAVLAAIERLAFEKKICAIGEIGLDFHYDHATPGEQTRAFREQLALTRAMNLPAIIHSRNAGPDILRAVQDETFKNGGILHCFTEDWEFAAAMLDAGFFISFSGIITFPKSQALREIAVKVPADRLLVETDAPYLAPVPHRGRRNEPAYVVETAACAARLKGMDLARFAEIITRNFKALFPTGSGVKLA
jgi:TatD DNase family protein